MRSFVKKVALVTLLAFVFSLLLVSKSAMALDVGTIYKKTLLNALQQCYGDEFMVPNLSDVSNFDNFFTKVGKDTNETVKIPNNNLGNTLPNTAASLSCRALFSGRDYKKGHANGLFALFEKGSYNGNANDFGYEEIRDGESATDKCIYFKYSYNRYPRNVVNESDRLCFSLDKDGYFIVDGSFPRMSYDVKVYEKGNSEENEGFLYYDLEPITLNYKIWYGVRTAVAFYPQTVANPLDGSTMNGTPIGCSISSDVMFSSFVNCLNNNVGSSNHLFTVFFGGDEDFTPVTVESFFEDKVKSDEESSQLSGNWWKGVNNKEKPEQSTPEQRVKQASEKALRFFTGDPKGSFDEYVFSPQEKYDIMKYYVELTMDNNKTLIGISTESCYDDVGELGDNYGVLQGNKWCKIDGVERITDSYNIVSDDNRLFETVNFGELIKRMMTTDLSEINIDESNIDGSSLVENPGESEEPTCLNTGAAGSLGWIICPILSGLSSAANAAYEDFIEPALQVSPKLFTDFGGNTWQAWSIFQGFANIVFIILFLVVIFSQLTGVGIDNYGIKKILPKLIIAAVLINLSYIICVALIDVSNIIGNALQSLFDALSQPLGIQPNASINLTAEGIKSIGATGLTGLALLGIVVVNIWAVVADGGGVEALVLALLVAAIGVVMAIFSLFLILAAREAAIVVLTIISPLAFACMILPNTKKLFEKWVGAGKALLMLYPICGLLVGGGNYVSKLLLSSGMAAQGFSAAFMAMVIGAVPIFFIPSLTKGSIRALGDIGNKISGMGKSFGNKLQGNADKAWKGSQGYKERAEDRRNQEAFRRARRIANGLERKRARNGGNLSERDMLRLSRAYGAVESEADRRYQAKLYSKKDLHDAKMKKQEFDAYSSFSNTMLYGDDDYLTGKKKEVEIQAEGNRERGVLYTRQGVADSKRSQMQAQIRSEIKKAHSERLSNASKVDKENALSDAIYYNNGISHEDAVEQMDAAWDALASSGDTDLLLRTLGSFNLNSVDQDMRDRIVAKAASSGNTLLKGWSKNPNMTLNNYAISSFNDYLKDQAGLNALNTADKETLEYLQGHGGSSLDAGVIANMATSAANDNERSARAVAAMVNRSNAAAIGKAINADGLTKLNETMVNAIGADNLKAAFDEIRKPGNEALMAKLDNKVKAIFEKA
ncbi:hypothetical protein IKD49_03260 [Candidatus Saccharibacteria bacterium]|nr:hypothetical protein [Candidatus Saccharibacteria bacterium]